MNLKFPNSSRRALSVCVLHGSLLCGVLLSVTSCAPADLGDDMRRVQSSLSDVRAFQAEQTTRISSIETELRQLSGRLEELEFSQKKNIGGDLSTLKQDLTDLKKRVPPPPVVPLAALEKDEGAISRMPEEVSSYLSPALQNIREGKFGEAQNLLKDALEISRGTEWAADVLFWTGVSYEGTDDHKDALQAYHGVVTDFPKHKKAALSLLREASVFVKLGDKKMAKVTLNKLIADFPKSEEAQAAKVRLKDL